MRNYFLMKYEQFLMRLFDKVCDLILNTRIDWYPKHRFCQEEEDKIIELEDKINNLEYKIHDLEELNFKLEYHMIDKDEEIEELSDKLYYYEKDLYEEEIIEQIEALEEGLPF